MSGYDHKAAQVAGLTSLCRRGCHQPTTGIVTYRWRDKSGREKKSVRQVCSRHLIAFANRFRIPMIRVRKYQSIEDWRADQ